MILSRIPEKKILRENSKKKNHKTITRKPQKNCKLKLKNQQKLV